MNCKAVAKHIINWMNDFLEQSHQEGFVLGVSGGVDSGLVSTLCAMTTKSTILLSLPIHQESTQLERALEHIKYLKSNFINVGSFEVDLTQVFENMGNAFQKSVNDDPLAMANLRARLRMSTIYAYAGYYKGIVVGTGNKIEDFGIGFFTKFGDGTCDISPIGGLSKSQVWELAKYLGVNEKIVSAKPTDGLWSDNRGDEDQIGATYPELEWAMSEWETGRAVAITRGVNSGITYTEREKEVLKIYNQRHTANQHKFNPIPVCHIPSIIL